MLRGSEKPIIIGLIWGKQDGAKPEIEVREISKFVGTRKETFPHSAATAQYAARGKETFVAVRESTRRAIRRNPIHRQSKALRRHRLHNVVHRVDAVSFNGIFMEAGNKDEMDIVLQFQQ